MSPELRDNPTRLFRLPAAEYAWEFCKLLVVLYETHKRTGDARTILQCHDQSRFPGERAYGVVGRFAGSDLDVWVASGFGTAQAAAGMARMLGGVEERTGSRRYVRLCSSHEDTLHGGFADFDLESGDLVVNELAPAFGEVPQRLDVEEWLNAYPGEEGVLAGTHDILDFGYWTGAWSGTPVYVPADPEFRKSFQESRVRGHLVKAAT